MWSTGVGKTDSFWTLLENWGIGYLPEPHQTHQDASGSHWIGQAMVRHVWSNLRASYAILERRTVVSGLEVLYQLSGVLDQMTTGA